MPRYVIRCATLLVAHGHEALHVWIVQGDLAHASVDHLGATGGTLQAMLDRGNDLPSNSSGAVMSSVLFMSHEQTTKRQQSFSKSASQSSNAQVAAAIPQNAKLKNRRQPEPTRIPNQGATFNQAILQAIPQLPRRLEVEAEPAILHLIHLSDTATNRW